MEIIDLIVNVLNGLQLPVWIPVLAGGVLRFLELRFNIFASKSIQKKH